MSSKTSKRCFKCGHTKPISEFYEHPTMADGHLNKCRDCAKRDMAEHRRGKGRERILAYDRSRSAEPDRQALSRKVQQEDRRLHPERYRAYRRVERAIACGELERGDRCEVCGRSDVTIHAHHEDYSKPLDVEWLCQHCHRTLRHRRVYPGITGNETYA